MPIFLALRRVRQEDGEFGTSLSYITRPPLRRKRTSGKVSSGLLIDLYVCGKASAGPRDMSGEEAMALAGRELYKHRNDQILRWSEASMNPQTRGLRIMCDVYPSCLQRDCNPGRNSPTMPQRAFTGPLLSPEQLPGKGDRPSATHRLTPQA